MSHQQSELAISHTVNYMALLTNFMGNPLSKEKDSSRDWSVLLLSLQINRKEETHSKNGINICSIWMLDSIIRDLQVLSNFIVLIPNNKIDTQIHKEMCFCPYQNFLCTNQFSAFHLVADINYFLGSLCPVSLLYKSYDAISLLYIFFRIFK